MSRSSEAQFLEIAPVAAPTATAAAAAERNARLPHFVGLRTEPGPALDALRVAIVGVGSVGRNLALHLARLHVAELCLIDRGRFKAESLLTQPIAPDDVGQPKASNTGRLCKAISPQTNVHIHDGGVEELLPTALADAHVVFLATDNLSAEVEVGQRCLHLRKPLLHASVHGETLVAQVRTFTNTDEEGPCPACGFGEAEWAHLNQETTFSCEGSANGQTATIATLPTMSVSFLCSLAADLALMQMLRLVLGLGKTVSDSMVQYCGYTHQVVVAGLTRNAACPCDHVAWDAAAPPGPLAACTPRELLAATAVEAGKWTGVSLAVDDLVFAESGCCEQCGASQPVQCFVRPGQRATTCTGCGGTVVGARFYSHRPVPVAVLAPLLDRPLHTLGAAHAQGVVIRGLSRTVLFRPVV